MGNQSTKPIIEMETPAGETKTEKLEVSPSVSSSSLSSESSQEETREERAKDVLQRVDSSDSNTRENQEACDNPPLVVEDDDFRQHGETTTCSMSSRGAAACIPSVLAFRRKENPLIVPPGVQQDSSDSQDNNYNEEDDDDDDDDDENDSAIVGVSSRKVSLQNCSTALRRPDFSRRRSWSPSEEVPASSSAVMSSPSLSTLSLASLLAKTKQQIATAATASTTSSSRSYSTEELAMPDGDLPTPESDLNRLRDYFIVTTAALPWMTGTAVNPLLRAASLSRFQRQQFAPNRCTVTLVVPWLEVSSDRQELYGEEWIDKTQDDQEAYIRDWLAQRANMPQEATSPEEGGGIRILFYPARYHSKLSSIFAMGDLCEFIATQNNLSICRKDAVCVLEEPEHVHFYRAQHWRVHFSFVCGVIHTNYRAYAESAMLAGSLITGPLIGTISSLLVRAYCDKVVKLSPVLQSFDCPEREVVSNVHGIRQEFIAEGQRRAQESKNNTESTTTTNGDKIYFIGKLLWAKGLDKLLELEALYRSMNGDYFPIDIYGSGPEQEEIQQEFLSEWPRFLGGGRPYSSSSALSDLASSSDSATTNITGANTTNRNSNNRLELAKKYYSTLIRPKRPVPARFMGRQDHALLTKDYKIFVNPSITEVLCTTTAEATAMGKFVIIPDHPSNSFFHQFPNCLVYKSKDEFVEKLQYAMTHEAEPLSDTLIHQLTWEAATQRFIEASAITRRDAKRRERVGTTKTDERIAKLHYELGKGAKGDVLRKVLGGGPVAHQFQYDRRFLERSGESSLVTDDDSGSTKRSNIDENRGGMVSILA